MSIGWLVIRGQADIKKGEIKFIPLSPEEEEAMGVHQKGFGSLVRSSEYFRAGELRFSVMLKNPSDKVQVNLGADGPSFINVALNPKNYAYGIAESIEGGWVDKSMQGPGISPPINEWLNIRINYTGSLLSMYVNEVRVSQARVNIHSSQVEIVYKGVEEAIIKDIRFSSEKPKAFVVMQFTDEYNALYKEVISPICDEYGYEVVRADDMYTTGLIIEDIVQAIRDSSLIIADITPDNPNVYYEVGYAHGINKTTILLSDKKRDKMPFDISGFRLLFYDNTIGGKSGVEYSLRKHLDALRNE